MARSLGPLLFAFVAGTLVITAAPVSRPAMAAEMDKKSKSDAKEAMALYKEGRYEEAAKLFARLSVEYPEMMVFVRNLGACYYYLRRPGPALSNLRDYLLRKKNAAADDRAEVERWIAEMERAREQASAPVVAAPPAPPVVASQPVAAPAPPAAPAPALVPAPAAPSSPVPPPPALAAAPAAPAPAAPQPMVASPIPAYDPSVVPAAPASPPPVTQAQGQPVQPPVPPATYPVQPLAPVPAAYPPGVSGSYAPLPPMAATTAPPPSSSHGSSKAGAWIVGGISVGALGVGAVFTSMALNKFSATEKKYDPKAETDGKSYAKISYICYGAGGAGLVLAIILAASGGSSSPSSVALAPVVGSGAAGASISGRF